MLLLMWIYGVRLYYDCIGKDFKGNGYDLILVQSQQLPLGTEVHHETLS
jgi:hypothetical protein